MLVARRGFNYEVVNKQKKPVTVCRWSIIKIHKALGALICLRWSLVTPNQLRLCYGNLDDAAAAIND
ncbi:hypothetical protein DEO72_LG6g3216 [Vigna unguiculata]|uniref:Uncharacterized protein n=1 Tax=Vigna unguiculata TaxID=3917 RepID=A0A4D6MAX5_VIGUN|nr:hypothetical protein DEO72_LG6g3216 [Vigna unguiculata]